MRTIFLCVFLLSPFVSYAQSQPPSPSPAKAPQPPEQQAGGKQAKPEPQQGSSDDHPLIVKVIAGPTAQPSKEDKTERDAELETDLWNERFTGTVAIFTVVLAIATGLMAKYTFHLWQSTDKLWLASIEQSKDVKESLTIARESADHTKAIVKTMEDTAKTELRAYIGITDTKASSQGVRIKYRNGGATPAYKAVIGGWAMLSKMKHEQIKEFARQNTDAFTRISEHTIWKDMENECLIPIPDMEERKSLTNYICGLVGYYDVFGIQQVVPFQFKMEWHHGWHFTECS